MGLNGGKVQIIIVSFLAFSCPGMFNAMSGLGGAGSTDATTANNSNTALYACFAIFGYFGGMIFNLCGSYGNKILMGCGGLTYVLYAVGQYAAGHDSAFNWLAILSGALLGVGAGLFWTAQGAMMMAYAPEEKKGSYISLFWVIFNLGGCLGGLLVFAVNFHTESGGASAATYFTFAGIMAIGSIAAFFLLVNPNTVIREDGEAVIFEKAANPLDEFKNVALMFLDKHMLLLTPLFATSNFFYSYQFNAVNGALFTIRARGLNSALYWASQMLGAFLFGKMFLDQPSMSRKKRATLGGMILAVFFTVAWGLGCYLQLGWQGGYDKPGYECDPKNANCPADLAAKKRIDVNDGGMYIYPIICFLLYGMGDAMLQTYAYWIMGAITNDLSQAARYTGFYKGVQSGFGAIAWQLDNNANWVVQLFVNWAMFTVAVPFYMFVAYKYVTNTSRDEIATNAGTLNGDKSKMDASC
eukprot:comp23823_c0_seq2/m.41523 comp23823_c0_seq2/g.41523  ORF comp23823_c0_seq2/g.41523 comp23823_c0_seq2/m.41523 type:complete len:469 (-) comp23823_c0_seq2:632-2038(-)